MFETVRNAFKIKDLRKKMLYTFFTLIVVRIGCQLPVPGVDASVITEFFESQSSLDFFNQLTGGSFSQMSIFALNITPYITASIIIQLLTIAIPRLEELHKDGEDGRKKLAEYTRYLTIALSVLESGAMAIGFGQQGYLTDGVSFTSIAVFIVSLTAGSAFL
nr:preprotein translocase subunit SecY [Lachnospiraceae bacterium]